MHDYIQMLTYTIDNGKKLQKRRHKCDDGSTQSQGCRLYGNNNIFNF